MGESTVTFAQNFKNLEILYAVDPFDLNYNTHNEFTDLKHLNHIEEIFSKNISKYSTIKHIKKDSESASKDFSDETFDFIYIDGCHDYECVYRDIEIWKPKIKSKGFMSFHDIDWPSVQKALSSFFNLNDGLITKDRSITFYINEQL